MADARYMQDYPQHAQTEERRTATTSRYPPSASDAPQRPSEASRDNMAASVSLPSIHDPRVARYGPPPHPHAQQGHPHTALPTRGYPADPRYASPNAVNGYPPPGQQPPPQQQPPPGYLAPGQQPPEARSGYPPPPDQRGGYYDDRRPPYEQYPPDAYYYRGGPPHGPPPNGYPQDYRGPPPGGAYPEYAQGQGGAPPITQAAPRQRTSIACRYCRKRKIRCSGYQSAPGGKCQNCARMNQECIFQPVSSSSSAAFIPVSAVPGGVPPGTQLFGAYGQPLAPNAVQGPPHQYPPPPGGPAPPPGSYYQQPMHSPTESYSSYGDTRGEDSQAAGRRRRRTPEEQEEGYRLPPPRAGGPEEEARRRSPAEFSNHSSPGGIGYPPYQGARHSPRNAAAQLPANHPGGGRSPVGQSGSSGASTPARPGQGPTSQPNQQGSSSVMSLSNLVDIDRTMIDRLNRPRDAAGNPTGGRSEGGR